MQILNFLVKYNKSMKKGNFIQWNIDLSVVKKIVHLRVVVTLQMHCPKNYEFVFTSFFHNLT